MPLKQAARGARRPLPWMALLAAAQAWAQTGEEDRVPGALAPVEVRGSAWRNATTEGSGAYGATHATVGGKDATPLLEIPNSVSVITRQRIEDQNLQTAEDALREVTGVTVTPWDGATYQIRSRGYFLEPSYDGIPSYGGLNATQQFDLAMFDRVEVLRGPAGLFQGSGQPGGTVNFVRRQGLSQFGGSATASAGSWSQYRAEASVGGPLNEAGTLRSRLVMAGHDREFYYERAESRKGMVYATLDHDLSPSTTLSVYGAYQDDKTSPFSGLPAYADGRFLDVPRSTNPYPSWAVYDTTTTLLATELGHRFDSGWKLRARYAHYTQDWGLRDSFPNTGVNVSTGQATYTRRGWDSETVRDLVDVYTAGPFMLLGRQHMATLGWSHGRHTNDTDYGAQDTVTGIPILDPDAVPEPMIPPYVRHYSDETIQRGVYGQVRLSLSERVTTVLGARSGDFHVRSRSRLAGAPPPAWTQGARARDEVTPYAGLVLHLAEQVTAYTSYADIFMPQTQRDADGRMLDPRVGRQVELGMKGSFRDDRLQAAAAVFRMNDRNRAYPDPDHSGSFLQIGETEVRGWEAELSGSPTAALHMSLGYTRLDTEYLKHQTLGGTPLSLFEPKHSLKAYANYRFAGSPWSLGGGAQLTSAVMGTGQEGVREQGGHGIYNLQGGYRHSAATTLSLSINNLFDRTYYARVGGLNSYNTYGEPRNWLLTVRTVY